MKVYCNKCKHRHSIERYAPVSVCRLTKYTIDHPTHQRTEYIDCDAKNYHNDCKDYEDKWFVTFMKRFTVKKEKVDEICERSEILDL